MVNNEQIEAFLNYNFIPFDKIQCIKRMIFVWFISAVISFIGNDNLLWILSLGTADLLISIIFIVLMLRYAQSQVSRYMSDGLFWLYMAIIFNRASYRIMAIQSGSSWTLSVILIGLLILCIVVFIVVTIFNIQKGSFLKEGLSKRFISLPYLGGAIGILVANCMLKGQSEQAGFFVLSYVLLILSFVLSIPSINLLKVFLIKNTFNKENN